MYEGGVRDVSLQGSVGMTEKIVINIDDVPLVDRGNGKQFAVKWGPRLATSRTQWPGLRGARRSPRQEGVSLPPPLCAGRVVLRRVRRG